MIWFIILLFILLGYVFNPYLTQLLNYVNYGFDKLIGMVQYIVRIITILLNSLSQYYYLMLMIAVFVAIKVIFYILDLVRG